jgi:uncharacterized protein with HEPN domain
MDNNIQTWLFDILNSIEEIESFFEGKMKIFNEYEQDLKTRRAVERNIEIIGEAVNRIQKADTAIKIENARNIIGTRNRIIHSYDNVSNEIIWSIVINSLPKLKTEIEDYLKQFEL